MQDTYKNKTHQPHKQLMSTT